MNINASHRGKTLARDRETFVSVLAWSVLLISFCRIVAFMYLTKAALYGLWTRNSEWRERAGRSCQSQNRGNGSLYPSTIVIRSGPQYPAFHVSKPLLRERAISRAWLSDICPPLMLTNAPHSEQNGLLLQSDQSQWTASDSRD